MLHMIIEILKYVALLLSAAATVFAVVSKAREKREPLSADAKRAIAFASASLCDAITLQLVNFVNEREAAAASEADRMAADRRAVEDHERELTRLDDPQLFAEVDVTAMIPADLTAFAKSEVLAIEEQPGVKRLYTDVLERVCIDAGDPRFPKDEWVSKALREMWFGVELFAGPHHDRTQILRGDPANPDRTYRAEGGTRRLVFHEGRWSLDVYQAPLRSSGSQRVRDLYSLMQLQGGTAIVTMSLPLYMPMDGPLKKLLKSQGPLLTSLPPDLEFHRTAHLLEAELSVAGQHALVFRADIRNDVKRRTYDFSEPSPASVFAFPELDDAFSALRGSPTLP